MSIKAHRSCGGLLVIAIVAAGSVGLASTAAAIPPPVSAVALDFDGDRQAELALWSPNTGRWRFAEVCDREPDTGCGFSHGHLTDASGWAVPIPGDYDGNGVIDPAVFDRSTATWRIVPLEGPAKAVVFGEPDDIPVPADYDGDGVADLAVFRPRSGDWIVASLSGPSPVKLGPADGIPVPADYDGDGHADPALFLPASGTWLVRLSTTDDLVTYAWGGPADLPVPADYDGDLIADLAVYQPGTGTWRIQESRDPLSERWVQWGGPGEVAVPADYDGDGDADIAVYRPAPAAAAEFAPPQTGWLIHPVPTVIQFGEPDEEPVGVPPAMS